jgi:hypothetical protein
MGLASIQITSNYGGFTLAPNSALRKWNSISPSENSSAYWFFLLVSLARAQRVPSGVYDTNVVT